ncbi:MAG: porin family protein [Acidobacteriia bacterium]|nr:porin family protein [Terriglobia bacterium]
MRKLVVLAGLLAVWMAPVRAQDAPDKPEPEAKGKKVSIPKFELSAGYAYRSYGIRPGGSSLAMNGGYGSVDYNYDRWLGAEAEVVGVYKDQGVLGKTDIYTFLVGPRVYPLGHHKLTPFGHLLFGAGRYSKAKPSYGGFPAQYLHDTAFAWEGGGGLDLYLRKHLGVRLIEVDLGHTGFASDNPTRSQSERRISVGIVYRFGER